MKFGIGKTKASCTTLPGLDTRSKTPLPLFLSSPTLLCSTVAFFKAYTSLLSMYFTYGQSQHFRFSFLDKTMDIYNLIRRALSALPDIPDDIIFLASILLAFASSALFIDWLQREGVVKQQKRHYGELINTLQNTFTKFEHLPLVVASIQTSLADFSLQTQQIFGRFDRLEKTVERTLHHDRRDRDTSRLSVVQDLSMLFDAIHHLEQKIEVFERHLTLPKASSSIKAFETEPLIPTQPATNSSQTQTVEPTRTYSEITASAIDARVPVPQTVTTSAIQTQETQPVLPGSDPKINLLHDQLTQMEAKHSRELQELVDEIQDYKVVVDALQNDGKKKDSKLVELENEVKKKNQVYNSLRNRFESLNERHTRDAESYDRFADEIATLTLQREAYRGRIDSLAATNEQLVVDIQYKAAAITQTEAELRNANEVLAQWELEGAAMAEEKKTHRRSLDEMSSAIDEMEAMHRSNVDDPAENEARNTENAVLMASNEQKEERIKFLETKITQLEKAVSVRGNDIKDIGGRPISWKKSAMELQQERDQVQQELQGDKGGEETGGTPKQTTSPTTDSKRVAAPEMDEEQKNTIPGDAIGAELRKQNSDSSFNTAQLVNESRVDQEEIKAQALEEPAISPEVLRKRNWDEEVDDDEDRISDSELRKFEAGTANFQTKHLALPLTTPDHTPSIQSPSGISRPQASPLPNPTTGERAQRKNITQLNPRKDFKLNIRHPLYNIENDKGSVDALCTACQDRVSLPFFKSGDEEMNLDWEEHLKSKCKGRSFGESKYRKPSRQERGGGNRRLI